MACGDGRASAAQVLLLVHDGICSRSSTAAPSPVRRRLPGQACPESCHRGGPEKGREETGGKPGWRAGRRTTRRTRPWTVRRRMQCAQSLDGRGSEEGPKVEDRLKDGCPGKMPW